ncbi:hypothetical protein N7509_009771 [Penicillium cosmopolitanum]|uniref:DUF7770 domain-containing protein n=1 Tax=Penicillium cosmopolitanum TaxID=1131564 RepID=A0A9X0B400_9EURO|nr:uncharacterized protein N7509_009771 [Penicillium cosmopolitanum]KAJ5387230.1 hypothetical protein N7509_009771 [Penicillium cosmopolitanum]
MWALRSAASPPSAPKLKWSRNSLNVIYKSSDYPLEWTQRHNFDFHLRHIELILNMMSLRKWKVFFGQDVYHGGSKTGSPRTRIKRRTSFRASIWIAVRVFVQIFPPHFTSTNGTVPDSQNGNHASIYLLLPEGNSIQLNMVDDSDTDNMGTLQ